MIAVSNLLRPLAKVKHSTIDSGSFKLHYRATTSVLLAAATLISSKQFFGEPIQCMSDSATKDIVDAIESYCWIHGIFTLNEPGSEGRHINGKGAIEGGVHPYTDSSVEVYHRFYQWAGTVLIVQALLFYFPHYLWKIWEGGRVRVLTAELDTAAYPLDKWTDSRKIGLIRYFTDVGGHSYYALRFAFCEILNLVNVIFQFLVLNNFFGGSFQNLGPAVQSFFYDPNDKTAVDPMAAVFPKVTKCTYHYFGSSGGLQNMDFVCVLPLNMFNEKVYALLWVWFLALAFVTAAAIAYRLFIFVCPCVRAFAIMSQARTLPRFQVMNIVMKFGFGDWFLLHQLGKNLNPTVYRELLLALDKEYEKKTVLV